MTIQDLLAENEVLRAENAALKQQLGYYEVIFKNQKEISITETKPSHGA